MREIAWRVNFFNKKLQERLQTVSDRFKALDMSSELFMMQ